MERFNTLDESMPILSVASDGFLSLDPSLFGSKVIIETKRIKLDAPTSQIEECLYHREAHLLAILVLDKELGYRLFTFFTDQEGFSLTSHHKNGFFEQAAIVLSAPEPQKTSETLKRPISTTTERMSLFGYGQPRQKPKNTLNDPSSITISSPTTPAS